jgi:hypothetical protein
LSSEPPEDALLGTTIADRYRVLQRLGEGGMGVVYIAEHLTLHKKVALKVIQPHWAENAELMARFKREAVSTAHLEHAHIVGALDFGELPDGSAFMVMPWVRGQSLAHALEKQGKMALRRAARLGAQIADALAAAHAIGIVHRDLKPDNVLLENRADGSEVARVLDFGIASLSASGPLPSNVAEPLTRVGTILGTPGYMAPEQAAGAAIDPRADLYALGVMLWEMCQGRALFPGDDLGQILSLQLRGPAPVLELGSSAEARALSELVQKLVELDKALRPQATPEVRDALRRIAEAPDIAQAATVAAPSVPAPATPPRAVAKTYVQAASTYVREAPRGLKMLGAAVGVWLLVAVAALTFGGEDAASDTTGAAPPESAADSEAEKALEEAGRVLLAERSRDSLRRSAARDIRKQAEVAPAYLVQVAELELTSRCTQKKEIVAKIRELADPRALPALERLADQPRRGCGLVRLNDCLACLRGELADAIEALRDD